MTHTTFGSGRGGVVPRGGGSVPWGVVLALVAALGACRAREGERCVCAEDCGGGLWCVAGGRVLGEGECNPAVGEDANPGVCLSEEEAGLDDDGGGGPEVFLDLGSKRDFDPGPPPDPETDGDPTTETGGTTEATGDTTGGTTAGTGSTGGTTEATTGSTGGTTDASTGSTGGSSGPGTTAGT